MRRIVLPIYLVTLAACASDYGPQTPITGTCADQYQQCARGPGDLRYCEDERESCLALSAAEREERTSKERGYEEFLRERDEAE